MQNRLISIIITTWNNENFIEQALNSCLAIKDKVNIIVVDNNSTDDTISLIERTRHKHPDIISIIKLDANFGPGVARNVGINHARSQYITFLDGDDWYEPKAFDEIQKILDTHPVDIIMYNHQRAYGTGRKKPNRLTKILKDRDVTDTQDRKNVMRNFSVAWNKIYRYDFIKNNNLSFPDGLYEDVTWSLESLLFAESIYVSEIIVVNYRQRAGTITKTAGKAHFDIFTRYRQLLILLKDNPELLNNYGHVIYDHAKSQILTVLNHPSRLIKKDRGDYMRCAYELLEEYHNELQIRKTKLWYFVLSTNQPYLWTTLRKINGRLKSIRKKTRKQYRKKLRTIKYKCKIFVYRHILLRKHIDANLVYFESFWGQKADCNPWWIAKSLAAHDYDIVWGVKGDAVIPENFPFRTVRIGSLEYYNTLSSAKYVISNTNVSGEIIKRSGTIHLETWHGTPLKVMGIDIRNYNPKEMNWHRFEERCSKWDYVLSSNPHSSRAWRSGMPYDYKMLEIGYPRNDILIKTLEGKNEDLISSIRLQLGIKEGKKVALYAPTYRTEQKHGNFVPEVSLNDMHLALGDEYVLLVRSHYFCRGQIFDEDGDIINVSEYPITNEIAAISDLLITDYSSIMFDFACLNRPIVLFLYDYKQYTDQRGVYFDITKIPPGAIAYTSDELLHILQSGIFNNIDYMKNLQIFRDEFCPWDDGYATDRVIKVIFKDVTNQTFKPILGA